MLDMQHLTVKEENNVPEWVTIIIRSLGALAMLFVITRIMGKKQISQLTFFEYVTGITLGEVAGFMSTEMETHYSYGVIVLLIWFIVPLSLEYLTLKSKTLRDLFEGKGRILIEKGKVQEMNLRKERLTADELMEQLRSKNVFRLADVEFAMMEASGDLSILLKKENQPVTLKDLRLTSINERQPIMVISDGEVLYEGLAKAGFSTEWLDEQLQKLEVLPEHVYIAQVDGYGELTVDLYNDMMQQPQPKTRPLLLATLKKCQADLECFGLSVSDRDAKRMYEQCAEQLETVVKDLTPVLKS